MKRKFILCSVLALAAAGLLTLDLHAAPGDLDSLDANIEGTVVYATAVQPDGKIIIGGNFTSVLGVPRNHVARLNADGTLDTGFNLNLSAFATVNAIALQPDGKVLLGGINIRGAHSIGRFNVDGMLDVGFDPNPNGAVLSMALQADGKVLLGGFFTALQPNGAASPTTRNYVARVNTDGTLDAGFDPNAEFYVYSLAVQTDGKIVLGGFFRTLQPNGAPSPTTRNYVARVNSDGTLDAGFDPNPSFWVYCVAVQADGKVVFSGDFLSIRPAGAPAATPRQRLARVNADGTLDAGFDPSPNGRPVSIALLADGTMLLGGHFTTLQPNGTPFPQARSYIARLNGDGTFDTAFNPNPNRAVRSINVQADGRVLIGGEFTTLRPNGASTATPRNFFARLFSYPTEQTLSLIELPRLRYVLLWHRAGATPELTRATFEFSEDGGATFGPPVAATRSGTSADWEILLLRVTGSGVWRARGYTGDGQYNGSSSLIQQNVRFGPDRRVAIAGLFNTGVDSVGTPLGHGATDTHYRLVAPSPVTGTPIVATKVGGFPIPPWVDDNTISAWITPATGTVSPAGDYIYETTFDLTGMDVSTASLAGRWATDDTGTDILLNGTSTGVTSGGFGSFTPFQIPSGSGFIAGPNTLTFRVNNAGTGTNPSGLRVEITGLAVPNLRITSITKTGSNVTLTWISQPGRTYRVQSTASLPAPAWTDVPGDVVAMSGVSSKSFTLGNAGTTFYRVALLPQ